MITASSGTGGLAGAPGLKEMVYENRASYAQRWGRSRRLLENASCGILIPAPLRLRVCLGKHNKL